jgi:hypothetical protein
VPAVRAALNKRNGIGELPIHVALRDAATGLERVRAMLDAGGEALCGGPGSSKFLPLHIAAMNSRSPAVVALLMARGPAGSARAASTGGGTPLLLAENFSTGSAAEEINALLCAAM